MKAIFESVRGTGWVLEHEAMLCAVPCPEMCGSLGLYIITAFLVRVRLNKHNVHAGLWTSHRSVAADILELLAMR